jgi:uncharacterized membrane protein YagU involved in acid resistance
MENKITIRRRVKSTAYNIISQALLVALAISWAVHMVIIAVKGSVYFVENNPYILWSEIIGSVLIVVFAVLMLSNQIQRLGERRRSDDRQEKFRN